MRRWLYGAIIVILTMIVFAYFGIKWYLGSAEFADRASVMVSDALDADIEFKQPFVVESLFPAVEVRVPSTYTKIQSEEQVSRVRVKDVGVNIPVLPLLLKRRVRGMSLTISDVSVIAQEETPSRFSLAEYIRELPVLWQLFVEMMHHEAHLSIARLEYFERTQKGTTTERAESIAIDLSPQDVTFSLDYITSDGVLPLTLAFVKKELVEGETDFALRGKAKVGSAEHAIVSSFEVNAGEEHFTVSSLKAGQGANIIEGELTIVNATGKKQRPKLSGEILLKRLDVATLNSPLTTGAQTQQTNQLIFSGDLIPYKALSEIHMDIEIVAGAVRIEGQPFVNGVFHFKNTKGSFSLASKEAQVMSAPLSFSYVGKKLDDRPYFTVAADLAGVPLERLGAMVGSDGLFDRGVGHFKTDLAFHGEDLQTHARTLDGAITIVMDNAHMTDGFSKWLDQGIVSHVKGLSAKKQRASSGRDIPCANAYVEIANGYGIVDESILIETPDNLLISSGFIDLHHETLSFSFRTKSRRMIDWSPLSMVKYMEIGGSLVEPKVKINEEQIAKKGAMTALSIFAGPIPGLAISAVSAAKNKKRIPVCQIN